MEAHGYSSALRSQYVRSGWLYCPARRVYRRSRTPLSWQHAVVSLQRVLGLPLVVGGRTALEGQGYAHYLPAREREVHLYGPLRPPTWLGQLPLDVSFRWHNSLRLFPAGVATPRVQDPIGLSAGDLDGLPVLYSTRERALLELLDELPARESFHQVDALVSGLSDLRPAHIQALLEACASVKVKRLFFFFADRHRHAWLARVDRSPIDLGSGKRLLVRGGRLDARYAITVPADLEES